MNKKLIIVYDFDGTLTPYSFPQYGILNDLGYDEIKMKELVSKFGTDVYLSYMKAIYEVFETYNIPRNMNVFYDSADKVKFNKGVLDYFKRYSNNNVKHYIVTSGFEDFVKRTEVGKCVTHVYGTTVTSDVNFCHKEIMTDYKKVDAIKNIINVNNSSNVIYFGDGLTDREAFMYVHNIGGTCVLVYNSKESESYKLLCNMEYIDYRFKNDYSVNSEIDNFIKLRVDLL